MGVKVGLLANMLFEKYAAYDPKVSVSVVGPSVDIESGRAARKKIRDIISKRLLNSAEFDDYQRATMSGPYQPHFSSYKQPGMNKWLKRWLIGEGATVGLTGAGLLGYHLYNKYTND